MSISSYYMSEEGEDSPFICSAPRENGMRRCHDVPASSEGGAECSLDASSLIGQAAVAAAGRNGCVNWNQYYNICKPGDNNPHKDSVNFDNIAYAWIAIFQVRETGGEGGVDRRCSVWLCVPGSLLWGVPVNRAGVMLPLERLVGPAVYTR